MSVALLTMGFDIVADAIVSSLGLNDEIKTQPIKFEKQIRDHLPTPQQEQVLCCQWFTFV